MEVEEMSKKDSRPDFKPTGDCVKDYVECWRKRKEYGLEFSRTNSPEAHDAQNWFIHKSNDLLDRVIGEIHRVLNEHVFHFDGVTVKDVTVWINIEGLGGSLELTSRDCCDRVALKTNNVITNDPCALCGMRTDPCGLDFFLDGTSSLVCDECAKRIDPGLYATQRAAADAYDAYVQADKHTQHNDPNEGKDKRYWSRPRSVWTEFEQALEDYRRFKQDRADIGYYSCGKSDAEWVLIGGLLEAARKILAQGGGDPLERQLAEIRNLPTHETP